MTSHRASFLAHEPQNPRPGGSDTLVSQARPDLATAFAVEPALGDHCPDIEPSMSRRGNCWDNAAAESFFSNLKKEKIRRKQYKTRDQARSAVL